VRQAGIDFNPKMRFLLGTLKFIAFGTLIFFSIIAAVVLSILSSNKPPSLVNIANLELVMDLGDRIAAGQDGDAIEIVAEGDFKRSYTQKSCTLISVLNGRRSRWLGSLGIYSTTPSLDLLSAMKMSCHGLIRADVEEAQIHFPNEQFGSEWLRRRPGSYTTVWNSNG
jgi:hypothetical protein